jgi:hypothetical protein
MKITTDSSSSKSLTPQRKHRKLLKSGEGEVWSEDVEQVFVEGHSFFFFLIKKSAGQNNYV